MWLTRSVNVEPVSGHGHGLHRSYLDVIPIWYYLSGVAKLTVYIPDDLLDRTRALNPDANTSQLVQRGLDRLAPADDSGYARRPLDAAELLTAAASKIREGAAREYEKGYRAALVMVSEAGDVVWRGLDSLARKSFDLPRWAESWREGLGMEAAGLVPGSPGPFKFPDWYVPFLNDLGSMLDPISFDQWNFTQSGPFVRGYQAALRDAWETADRPEASSTPAGDTAAEDGRR